jgi:glycine betaine/proline transport system substrate-binding protein
MFRNRVFLALLSSRVEATTRVTDASCTDAREGCQGICYEVPDQHFFESCLVGEAPVVEAILPTPSYATGSCRDFGFVPLTRVPGGTSVPDFCYGNPVSRSLVDVYVSDEDWFFGATVDAGKFNPDVDCPAWQQRNPQCMKPMDAAQKHLVVGTAGVSFHQTANWVVVRALEKVGYSVDVVDNMPHREMYPKFTAGQIDVVTGSDLPFNHAPWLWNYTQDFFVAGTINEATDIVLGVPSYTGVKSVSELTSVKSKFSSELLSLDEDACPQCVNMAKEYAKSHGFTVREVSPVEFQQEVEARTNQQESFIVSWYVPSYLQSQVAGLVNLVGDEAPWNRHNAGKTIVRHDSDLDTDTKTLLGAVFVGNAAMVEMDLMVNVKNMSTSEAADAWIQANPEMWNSFFGHLPEPSNEAMFLENNIISV